jgi:surface polysaccharide O-acyltransferase-like enzyme
MSDITLRRVIYRNALFIGFPFVFLGYFIRKKEREIAQINMPCLLFVLIAGFAALLMESYRANIAGIYCDIHLSLILLCPTLLVTVLRFSKYAVNDGYIGKMAAGVYFVHPLVAGFVYAVLNYSAEVTYLIVLPVIFFLSMIFSAGIIAINKRIKVFL